MCDKTLTFKFEVCVTFSLNDSAALKSCNCRHARQITLYEDKFINSN